MPPIQAAYDNNELLSWNTAPYRPRSRQRNSSFRGDSLRDRPLSMSSLSSNGSYHGHSSHAGTPALAADDEHTVQPHNLLPTPKSTVQLSQYHAHLAPLSINSAYTSPLRQPSSATSSNGSSGLSSLSSSFISNASSVPTEYIHTDRLSESPEELHKFPQTLTSSSSATTETRHHSSSGLSNGSRPMPTRRGSHTHIDPYTGLPGLPPPVQAGAFAPLDLDSSRAQELDGEEPLTLPQPWAYEAQRTRSSSFIRGRRPSLPGYSLSSSAVLGAGSLGVGNSLSRSLSSTLGGLHPEDLTSTRSKSPTLSRPSLPPPSHSLPGMLSSIPPNVPKSKFVEGLVGAACIAVEVVWKVPDSNGGFFASESSSGSPSGLDGSSGVLPLRHFIKEVLRRSRSTCSTLQTALYYIHKSREYIRTKVKYAEEAKQEILRRRTSGQVEPGSWNGRTLPSPPHTRFDQGHLGESNMMATKSMAELLAICRDPVLCGRRMFLAALISASKFLQDRTYSNRAWAKISSLPLLEINENEKAFLQMLDYNLYVDANLFRSWAKRLQDLADKQERKEILPGGPNSGRRPPPPSTGGMSLPQRALLNATSAASRDHGFGRSHSDYLPAPDSTDMRARSPHGHPILPRPQLSNLSRYPSSASAGLPYPTRLGGRGRTFSTSASGPIGSCSNLARLLNDDGSGRDWQNGSGSDMIS